MPKKHDALAVAMGYLLSKPYLMFKMGQAGKADEMFNVEIGVGNYVKICDEISKEK